VFDGFFKNTWKDLKNLNLMESQNLTNESVIAISENCPKLQKIDISWCYHTKNEGIQALLINCKHLEKISVKGCKNLTEDCFPGLNLAYKAMTKEKDDKFWKQLTWAKPDEFRS